MSEASIQVLIRVGRLILVAVLGVLIASAGVLVGLIPDDNTRYLAGLILVPFLEGLAKLIGGPTAPAPVTHGLGEAGAVKRPSFLSV